MQKNLGASGNVHINHQNRGKFDLSDFSCSMIVAARWAGLSISVTVDLLGFSCTTISSVRSEWCENQKTSGEQQSCGRKCLVDERGQLGMTRLV